MYVYGGTLYSTLVCCFTFTIIPTVYLQWKNNSLPTLCSPGLCEPVEDHFFVYTFTFKISKMNRVEFNRLPMKFYITHSFLFGKPLNFCRNRTWYYYYL